MLKAQSTSEKNGLTQEEAAKRLSTYGENKLKESGKTSIFKLLLRQISDPMIIILIIAAAVSLAISIIEGGEGIAEVVIIAVVVILNAVLGVVQESKAENAIAALQEMTAATSKVIRDGKQITVKSSEIVPGDIVVLEAGDAVPADMRIIMSASLKIEEAALTGESVPSEKHANTLKDGEVPLGDRANMAYMGSTVVYGRATVCVCETAMGTEMGKIATALETAEKEETPLQIKLNQLSKILTYLVLGICAVIFAIDLIREAVTDVVTLDSILDTFMIAISLAVAAIPEGLAAVVTIVLSIGVTKMSKNKAIIRKLTAVETLGCTEVICSDKTGTLTQNKMTVGEPTECALVNWAYKLGFNKNSAEEGEDRRVGEAPFDSSRKLMSTVHVNKEKFIQFTKGAPDELLKKCTKILKDGSVRDLTDSDRAEILAANKAFADKALRVLAAAYVDYDVMPSSCKAEDLEHDLTFIGLSGMIDPVRPEVKAAIEECRSAGIRPVMITGDHKDTAIAIAKELGIISDASEAITGSELDKYTDDELDKLIVNYGVYARVQPEHKVRIVQAWKKQGKVVAMTGDGVNDAPSIKNADIGVGMGITGTDVTKNVADMVLADDNFATIVEAVAEGRRIYDNIRKAIQFLLASNFAEVLSIFFSSLMGFTILRPAHLLWINLITDCFPAIALGMERGEEDIMQRPPRKKSEGVFAGGMGFDCVFQGVVTAALTLLSYFIGEYIENGAFHIVNSEDGMTMAFLTLSMIEIFHSFNMRSLDKSLFSLKGHNKYLYWSLIGSFIATVLVLYVPFLRNAFSFQHISIFEFAVALILAFMIIPIVEIQKVFKRAGERKKNA